MTGEFLISLGTEIFITYRVTLVLNIYTCVEVLENCLMYRFTTYYMETVIRNFALLVADIMATG